jgi:hypothetical protein
MIRKMMSKRKTIGFFITLLCLFWGMNSCVNLDSLKKDKISQEEKDPNKDDVAWESTQAISQKTLTSKTEDKKIETKKMVAVPIFFVPNPTTKASIDALIEYTSHVSLLFEQKVIESFKNQPHIKGIPFGEVRKKVQSQDPNLLERLNERALTITKAMGLSSHEINPSCYQVSSFLQFYAQCLAKDEIWKKDLEALRAITKQDTYLMLIFITHLKDKLTYHYEFLFEVNVFLLAPYNNEIAWANSHFFSHDFEVNTVSEEFYLALFERLLNQKFWNKFPGRI